MPRKKPLQLFIPDRQFKFSAFEIQSKSKLIAKNLGLENFTAYNSMIEVFKHKNSIYCRRINFQIYRKLTRLTSLTSL